LYLRLKPNHLTLIGLAFFGLASALILQKSSPSWIIAAWLIALGGSLDFFDGWVARVTKHASEQGAVFDSLVDRLSEGILFCSFFWILSSDIARWILLLAFWGSMMTSYLRSIGERLGVAMCQGVLQRPGRFGILAIGLWLAGVFSFFPHASLWLGFNASHVLQGAFILIAMLSWITVLQRSLIIFRDFNDSVDSQPLKK
jgi:CDP-diacylglycerol--glycerol-3-phosphate 3-phosphatidyltransferase